MGKYLIQIFIRELHNDLIKPKNEGGLSEVGNGNKLLVCDTGLRYIIPVNVKKFNPRYEKMCGCEVCIQAKKIQRSINALINRQSKGNTIYRRVVIPNDMTLHPKLLLIGTFGAMRTNDEATQGYYLVKWIREPYAVQEDTVMEGVEPHQSTFAGEIICDAVF